DAAGHDHRRHALPPHARLRQNRRIAKAIRPLPMGEVVLSMPPAHSLDEACRIMFWLIFGNRRPQMQRRYITVDVFTDRAFGGNPLAVVLDAGGLSTAQMQAIATEFNYSETTFVLPPRDSKNDAWVRIFTVNRELPFAGHPNVGTAFVLARQAAKPPEQVLFEEGAGLVPVAIL